MYIGIMTCDNHVDMSQLYSEIGPPIDTYIGTNATANVCMVSGLSLPRTRLNQIKEAAQTNMEIIKKGMEASKDSLFGDSVGFLGAFDDEKQLRRKRNSQG